MRLDALEGDSSDYYPAIPRMVEVPVEVFRILELLGLERVVQLGCLLQDVMDDTGFGDVKLVVAEGKVALIKVEKSYK